MLFTLQLHSGVEKLIPRNFFVIYGKEELHTELNLSYKVVDVALILSEQNE